MGFKSNWRTCGRSELVEYFNTIHKVTGIQISTKKKCKTNFSQINLTFSQQAFDMHLAVAILRLEKGLDYSLILENSIVKEDEKSKPKDTGKDSNGAQLPESNLAGQSQSQINSSNDSLDKTISQGKKFYLVK